MSIETEVKLALPPTQVEAAQQFFTRRTGVAGREIALGNLYFDTPERALAGAHAALRLRRTPHGWLQTFKAGGTVRGGLHQRAEWELPVAGAALEWPALLAACAGAPAAAVLAQAAAHVVPLFQTDFTRTLWLVGAQAGAAGGIPAEIEAAIDIGAASATVAGTRRCSVISEIELELKSGPDSALHALALELRRAIAGLIPDDVSKAERGYRLLRAADGDPREP